MQQPNDQTNVTTRLEISFLTVVKVVVTLGLCALVYYVKDFLLLLLLSILVAITLAPVLARLTSFGISRSVALIILSITVFGVFSGFLLFLVPPVVTELGNVSASLPKLEQSILQNAPKTLGLNRVLDGLIKGPVDGEKLLSGVLSVGQTVMGGATSFVMLLIFALYFLADGPRAYTWLLPYFSVRNQERISVTTEEVLKVVTAYISGQLLTSLLAAVFTFVLLSFLAVPAALVLSIIAGIFDILPIVGFLVFIVLAVTLSFTVSSTTALTVLIAYTAYHMVENYILVPKIYGARMRLSGLVVLFGVVFGGLIAGIPGAVSMLPILASYPIVERIWLARQVGRAAIAEHKPDAEPYENSL